MKSRPTLKQDRRRDLVHVYLVQSASHWGHHGPAVPQPQPMVLKSWFQYCNKTTIVQDGRRRRNSLPSIYGPSRSLYPLSPFQPPRPLQKLLVKSTVE